MIPISIGADPKGQGRATRDELSGRKTRGGGAIGAVHDEGGNEKHIKKEQDPGDRLYGREIDAAGNHPEADQQGQPVGNTRIHDDDGQKARIPEWKAFAVAHHKSAV